MDTLLHVTNRAEWAAAGVALIRCPPGGFIHLCTPAQLAFVLGRHFAGRTDLVLITLHPAGLDIRWEASELGMDPFPHLYADLPPGSVIETRAL